MINCQLAQLCIYRWYWRILAMTKTVKFYLPWNLFCCCSEPKALTSSVSDLSFFFSFFLHQLKNRLFFSRLLLPGFSYTLSIDEQQHNEQTFHFFVFSFNWKKFETSIFTLHPLFHARLDLVKKSDFFHSRTNKRQKKCMKIRKIHWVLLIVVVIVASFFLFVRPTGTSRLEV